MTLSKKGWTSPTELCRNDFRTCHDRPRMALEYFCDTGEYETVYNLRVGEYHPYFINGHDRGQCMATH